MKHNEPTIPGPYTHNEPTIADSYYPYSGGSEIPPPPPGIHKSGIRAIIFMSVVCIILAGAIGAYVLGTNKETQKSNDNITVRVRATSTSILTSTITHTPNLNYTALDIGKDIQRVARISPLSDTNTNVTIWSWSYDTWASDVPFTSSVNFGDYGYCGNGNCTPPQVGIWVYASEKDTSDAYNEIIIQIKQGKVPQGPAGIDTVAYMHGRCLLLGESGASIYGQVVRKDCT